jgi:hypothetical protein
MHTVHKSEVAHARVLLPVVQRTVHKLDDLFVEYTGPVGSELAVEVFHQWVKAGKVGPSELSHYVFALGSQLDEPAERKQFKRRADQMLAQLQSGFNS